MNEGMVFILFAISALAVGAVVRSLAQFLILPYSVILLLVGLSSGLLFRQLDLSGTAWSQAVENIISVDPHLLLFLFLPTLIFESAFSMETHLFKRSATQISLLAVPGLLLAVLATAITLYFMPLNWSWLLCLLFGTLISATDPVAVVALLKEVSSRKRLETLIEGESLINDGSAIVLFSLFSSLLFMGLHFEVSHAIYQFFKVTLGGLLIGLLAGYLALLWIERVFNNVIVEITISIFSAYLVYFIAEQVLHLSGIVAVVAMALVFAGPGRTRISNQGCEFLHAFWEMMAYLANTVIFILVGLIVALKVRLDNLQWWYILLLLYFSITLIRALAILILTPLLKRVGIGLTKEKMAVLIWGGLRGAVSLALALTLVEHPAIPAEVGEQILFFTAGIVVLTISINASTMKWLLAYLGLNELPAAKKNAVIKAKNRIYEQLHQELDLLKKEPLLLRVNWPLVGKRIFIAKEQEPSLLQEQDELELAFFRRLLETERRFYWLQYRSGAIEGLAVSKLVDGVERALDGKPELGPRRSLFHHWQAPKLVKLLSNMPWLNRLSLNVSFSRMALGYEVARGYLQAQTQLQTVAEQLAPNERLLKQVNEQLAINKKEVMLMLSHLQESFPEVAYSLETQTASRLLLNRERFLINELVAGAQLEASEAKKMIEEVDSHLLALKKMPKFTTSQDYLAILELVACFQDLSKSELSRLARHATRRIHSQGELLVKAQDLAKVLPILCRGHVSSADLSYNKEGSLLGLEAVITGHFKHELHCDGPCDVIWLELVALRELCSSHSLLARRITYEVQQQIDI